jgi:hypothetical protein
MKPMCTKSTSPGAEGTLFSGDVEEVDEEKEEEEEDGEKGKGEDEEKEVGLGGKTDELESQMLSFFTNRISTGPLR